LQVNNPLRFPRSKGGRGSAGRPLGASSDLTKAAILDSAEELFANSGYDGTSIRDIASAAGVAIAVITYHFGAKEHLFDAVIQRRATVLTQMRLAELDATRRQAGAALLPIELLVRSYVSPFVVQGQKGDRGWRNYAALMGRLSNSVLGTSVIHRHYDEMARQFLVEFQRSLPQVDSAAIVGGFMTMVSAMLFNCAATGRSEALSAMLGQPAAKTDTVEQLVRFCVAGFRGLIPCDD
jgi:AcrR family transcriptional regulator